MVRAGLAPDRMIRWRKTGRGDWCIGNTVVSKTATPGSIPGSPARKPACKSPQIAGFWRLVDGLPPDIAVFMSPSQWASVR
jgi:hypothetical protein